MATPPWCNTPLVLKCLENCKKIVRICVTKMSFKNCKKIVRICVTKMSFKNCKKIVRILCYEDEFQKL